jgi:hypothetical protein
LFTVWLLGAVWMYGEAKSLDLDPSDDSMWQAHEQVLSEPLCVVVAVRWPLTWWFPEWWEE